jgi:hypothetical protein
MAVPHTSYYPLRRDLDLDDNDVLNVGTLSAVDLDLSGTLTVDTIDEHTASAGVTIEGMVVATDAATVTFPDSAEIRGAGTAKSIRLTANPGPTITLYGNTHATRPGELDINSGGAGNKHLRFYTAVTERLRIDGSTGDVDVYQGLTVDTIDEHTGNAGVTIEGVLLKDNDVLLSNDESVFFGSSARGIKWASGNGRVEVSGGMGEPWYVNAQTEIAQQMTVGPGASVSVYFRDAQISIASATDGHLDLTADVSIDLNGVVVATSSVTAEDVYVTDGGNVGIAGNELLTFNAAGNITVSGADIVVPDDFTIGLTGGGHIEFDNQATDEVNFISCNVGIGTNAPAHPLDVTGIVQASGVFYAPDGALAAPAYSFTAETGSGMWRFAAGVWGFSTNNANAIILQATGTHRCYGNWRLRTDNHWIGFGSGSGADNPDATIYYNATNLIIDPDVIGAGSVLIGATGDDDMQLSTLTVGGDIVMAEDAWIGITGPAERLVFDGSGGLITVTASHLRLDSTNQAQFGDAGTYIYQGADGHLDLTADTSVDINGILELEATTSTTGHITQAGTRLLHTYGTTNLFGGIGAGNFTLTGHSETAFGYHALDALTSGNNNTAIGDEAATALTTGWQNVAIGSQAMLIATDAKNCVFIGYQAGVRCTTAQNNFGIGTSALAGAAGGLTGDHNTAMGTNALVAVSSGHNNTGIGRQSGIAVSTGFWNTMIGSRSGEGVTTGDYNTLIGSWAGNVLAGANLSVMIGYAAGYYETASNKLFIDNAARANEADGRVKALIYGVFDAAVDSQLLRVNAPVELLSGQVVDQVTKSAAYTATAGDYVILCDTDTAGAAFTITLPAAASHTGRVYYVKNTGTGHFDVTVDGNGAETIDGAATQTVIDGNCLAVVCDGTEWWVI